MLSQDTAYQANKSMKNQVRKYFFPIIESQVSYSEFPFKTAVKKVRNKSVIKRESTTSSKIKIGKPA